MKADFKLPILPPGSPEFSTFNVCLRCAGSELVRTEAPWRTDPFGNCVKRKPSPERRIGDELRNAQGSGKGPRVAIERLNQTVHG